MASRFTPGKLYGLGQLCKEKGQEISGDMWAAFLRKEKIDAVELQYVIDGYQGNPFVIHCQEVIVPFAPFKGKKLSEMKTSYLEYLLGKEWLDNWGDLRLNIEHLLKRREKEKTESEKILEQTLKQLRQ